MAQRRFHYEQAFEHFLRANRVPYVAVDEAKKALIPARKTTSKKLEQGDASDIGGGGGGGALKSFDFVVYAPERNLLVDVKGRMFGSAGSENPHSSRRFESWVTDDDVESLKHWQTLFGTDFQAVFVFAYCLRQQPPDALFEEVFTFGDRWYVLREATLNEYALHMVRRSDKWHTVHVPGEAFAPDQSAIFGQDNARLRSVTCLRSPRGGNMLKIMRNRFRHPIELLRGRLSALAFMLMAALTPALVVLAQNPPLQPKLNKAPPVWLGYLVMFVLLGMVVAVSLMPSKRSHQD